MKNTVSIADQEVNASQAEHGRAYDSERLDGVLLRLADSRNYRPSSDRYRFVALLKDDARIVWLAADEKIRDLGEIHAIDAVVHSTTSSDDE